MGGKRYGCTRSYETGTVNQRLKIRLQQVDSSRLGEFETRIIRIHEVTESFSKLVEVDGGWASTF